MNRLKFVIRSTICLQNLLAPNKLKWSLVPQLRTFSIDQLRLQKVAPSSDTAGGNKQKNARDTRKITLIGQNQAISITTLEDAQKLARRRDLHLLQIQQLDSKTGRAVYKLVTSAEMLQSDVDDSKLEEIDKSSQKKSEKSLTIGSRITDHDLSSRLKNISKWLAKRHEVRILIQGRADDPNCERIVKAIEQSVSEPNIGKIVQKRSKGAAIKFNIIPITPISGPQS